jgi:NAD(P)-dependent dehydrogenase (short-subunit alcohol dehydrogenase family)
VEKKMNLDLAEKIAIVTGGGGDLGRAIVLALAEEGVYVTVADSNQEAAQSVANEVSQQGGTAIAVQVDVTKSDQVKAMVQETVNQLGSVDILVNNAGILGPQKPIVELNEDGWDAVVDVNLKGTFLCSKAVLPLMIAKTYGKIVNISSVAGKTGEPFAAVYSATKAAVINLTQGLALEVARYKINVNSVCPAGLNNLMSEAVFAERSLYLGITPAEAREQFLSSFPMPIPLTVDDVAKTVVFLSSDVSVQITGEAVNVTGGVEVH